MAVQVGPTVRTAYSAWNSEAGERVVLAPGGPVPEDPPGRGLPRRGRVATWGHWDAYYLARIAPLARGWYRQDDFPQNTVLYDEDLSPAAYQAWLRQLGVRYVMLPDTALDYSSMNEAKLLRSGRSGLRLVGQTRHWRFYELPAATPIVSGAVRRAGAADHR